MRRTAAFLSAGLLGVVALLSGLAVDSYLHAQDPNLAHREGLFALSNPGHVLLGIGIGLVVVGVVGAAYTTLPFGVWVRRGLLAGGAGPPVFSCAAPPGVPAGPPSRRPPPAAPPQPAAPPPTP